MGTTKPYIPDFSTKLPEPSMMDGINQVLGLVEQADKIEKLGSLVGGAVETLRTDIKKNPPQERNYLLIGLAFVAGLLVGHFLSQTQSRGRRR